MLSRRLQVGLAVIAAGSLALAAGDGLAKKKRGKKGKVVRVERTRLGGGAPRLCGNPRTDGGATCWGLPPEVGDVATVLDDAGPRGTVRISQVKGTLDPCGNVSSWEVSGQLQSGDLMTLNTAAAAFVIDWKTTTRSKAMNIYGNPPVAVPGQHPNEMLLGAVDDDADGSADLMLTWFYCDATGTSAPYGQGGHYCVVHYARDGGSYKQLRLDVVKNC